MSVSLLLNVAPFGNSSSSNIFAKHYIMAA